MRAYTSSIQEEPAIRLAAVFVVVTSVSFPPAAKSEVENWYFEGLVETLHAGVGGRGENVSYCDVAIGDEMYGWFNYHPTFADGDSSPLRGQDIGQNTVPDPLSVEAPLPEAYVGQPGALRAGKSLRWVSDQLGHADLAFTLRVYAHAMRDEGSDLSFSEFGGPKRLYPALEISGDESESPNYLESMARREGFEPPTLRFEA